MRNCDGSGDPVSFDFAPDMKRCPWSVIDDLTREMLDAWRRWTLMHVLPYGVSTMAELPQHVFEAFEICAQATQEMRAARAQKTRHEELQTMLSAFRR